MLSEVYFSRDLYMACLQLALSNEKEEVIGLLFGEVIFLFIQVLNIKNIFQMLKISR